MLYQIRHERPDGTWAAVEIYEGVGVSEYLETLPKDDGPYSASAIVGRPRSADRLRGFMNRNPLLIGIAYGLLACTPFYAGLYLVLHHFGVL